MNRLDEKIVSLKAALWENGNVNSLLSKAIRAYVDQNAPVFPTEDIDLYIGGLEITVMDVPHIMHNNELHENLLVMAALEDLLDEKYKEEVPKQVKFDSLLS